MQKRRENPDWDAEERGNYKRENPNWDATEGKPHLRCKGEGKPNWDAEEGESHT
jgi:hypothetical protein